MKASVIVLAWNGMAYLKECLDAVLTQEHADFEVLVVDNGSTDGSADFVAEHYPQVRLIRNKRNLGFAGGNNVGMRTATGDVLVLLNQDTKVLSGWLTGLIDTVGDPTVGIAGCKLLYPNGLIQHIGGVIVDARGSASHIGRDESDMGQYDHVQDVTFVTGAAIALTRVTLQKIGFLDENFTPAYYEDTDWCYRARELGLRVVVSTQSVAIHYESASSEVGSYIHRLSMHKGRLRFLFKHQSLEDLQTLFVPAESIAINEIGPGVELEAMRQAWMKTLFSLPDLVEFRSHTIDASVDHSVIYNALLHIALTLRALLAKPQPFYHVHSVLDITESKSVGVQLLQELAEASSSLDSVNREQAVNLAELHNQWRISPQPFHSDVPLVGAGLAAFREAWVNVATRWYVEPLLTQQRTFNANVTQVLADVAKRLNHDGEHLNRLAMSQVELLHIVRQMADNVVRAQQENAQHVRELNVLLSEVLQLEARVTDLESQLKA